MDRGGDDSGTAVDPDVVSTRSELGSALSALRRDAGLTVRIAGERSGVQVGTAAGWFAGAHVPTPASRPGFESLLAVCGAEDPERWWRAVVRARSAPRVLDGSPYKGLEPYSRDDAPVFHGRERLVAATVSRVTAAAGRAPVLVVGPSGAGKSSLVRAGVVPALVERGGPLAGAEAVVLAPGRAPGVRVREALAALDGRGLLVVDQLEDLFTASAGQADEVLDLLVSAGPDVAIVLVLRADFYAEAAARPVLLPTLADHQVVVGALDGSELREVVVEPARRHGREVDAELVEALLADLGPTGAAPWSLPLLSHALRATWERGGARLTLADYRATGSIAGAVAQSAEDVVGGLEPAQRDTARWVFLRLVAVDGPVVTRRVASPAELEDGTGRAAEVVARFADARLLTLGDDTVEVTHEALLTAWPRLRGWIDGYRDDARAHRRVSRAAAAWEAAERDPELLVRGGRLAAFAEWAADPARSALLNAGERDLLEESTRRQQHAEAAAQRRTRRLVRLSAAAVVLAVLALVAALVAALAVARADRQQVAAEQARDAAVAVQLATRAATLRERDPNLAAQLAVAAYRTDPARASRSALLDSTAGIVPARATGAEGSMAVALGRDGSTAFTARADGTVTVDRLDPRTGVPTQVASVAVDTGDPALYAAALDPTGRVLAVGGGGSLVRLVDVEDPTTPRVLDGGLAVGGTVRHLLWAPSGGQLAAASADATVHRWRVDPGGAATELPAVAETGPLQTAALSPDGAVLATGASDGTAKLWDVADAAADPVLLATVPTSTDTSFVLALAFSPDGATLALGGRDRVVRQLDVTDPRAPVASGPVLEGAGSYVNGLSFSPDGRMVAAAGSDTRTLVHDRDSGAVVATLTGPTVTTQALYLPDGRTVATASVDGVLRTWRLGAGPLPAAQDTVFNSDFTADGRLLVVGANAGENAVLLWDLTDPGDPVALPAVPAPPGQRLDGSVAVSRDGSLISSGTAEGAVVLWDARDPGAVRLRSVAPTGLGLVQNTDVSPDSRLLVAVVDPGVVVFWDVSDPAAPREVARRELGSVGFDVEVSPDGRTAAATAGDGTVRRWDVTDPDAPRELPVLRGFANTASALAFGPDSRRLVAGSFDRTAIVFDLADPAGGGQPATRLTGPAGSVIGIAFSADGTRVAGASEDGAVWLWDTTPGTTPTVVARLVAGGGRVFTAEFSPVAPVLVGFGAEASRAGRVWSTDPAAAAERLCSGVGTPMTEQEWSTYVEGVPFRAPCAS